jgi:hypothetical protein
MKSHQLGLDFEMVSGCGRLVDNVEDLQIDESSPHARGIQLPRIQIVNNSQVFPLPSNPPGP